MATDQGVSSPADVDDDLILAVEVLTPIQDRTDTSSSDGGGSGRSDSNDG